jgi:hypothetical protein
MPAQELAPAVVAFVAAHIRSLEELELLMAIIQSDGRWWDATHAARESGLTEKAAGVALDHFASHNLLDIRITEEVRYQFSPGTDELLAAATETADAYRKRPLAVAKLVTAQPSRRGVTDFADAFRIRRDDDR